MDQQNLDMHLTATRIQAFLDGTLPAREGVDVEEHVRACTSCRGQLDSWRLLYARLDDLPELAPSPGFASGVLARLDVAARQRASSTDPAASVRGAWSWLRRRATPGSVSPHIEPRGLQDFVEGILPRPQMARVRAHLQACETCRSEETGWRELFGRLETLPELAPSARFAQRVMAQVHIGRLVRAPAAGSASLAARVTALAGRVLPRTQRAWAVVSGIAVAPATVLALLAYSIFSSPLVTPRSLGSFLWWKVSGAMSVMANAGADAVFESSLVFHAYSALEALAGAPAVAVVIGLSFAAATSVSGWILYRSLLPTHSVDGEYVQVST